MIKEILQHSHPIWQESLQHYTGEQLLQILTDLYDTYMQNPKQLGVGLSARQIGYPTNAFLLHVDKQRAKKENCDPVPLCFWLNAHYTPIGSQKVLGTEACYSVANKVSDVVPRFEKVLVLGSRIEVTVKQSKIVKLALQQRCTTVSGFAARVIQHECDHGLPESIFYFDYLNKGYKSLKNQTPTTTRKKRVAEPA